LLDVPRRQIIDDDKRSPFTRIEALRFGVASHASLMFLLNQVRRIADDPRRLETPRFKKSVKNASEDALAIRCLT
jgi:hypothetical protein